jgi:hypothetical protein
MTDQTSVQNLVPKAAPKPRKTRGSKKSNKTFNASQRDPEGFTLEEREDLLRRLAIITDRGSKDIQIWKAEIEDILRKHRSLSPLVKLLPDTGTSRNGSAANENETRDAAQDEQIREVLAAATRIVEAQPVTALGYAVRSRIREAVNEDLWSSSLVRIARWAAPVLVALLFGGTIWYSIHIKGIVDGLVDDARQATNKAVADITAGTEKANRLITELDTNVGKAQEQYKAAATTLNKTNSALDQAQTNLTQQSQAVTQLKDQIAPIEKRVTDLQTSVSQTELLVQARDQLAQAIKNYPVQLTEPMWRLVLNTALYETIVVVIAGIFILINLITLSRRLLAAYRGGSSA